MTDLSATVIHSRLDTTFPQWQPATWEDYLACSDDPSLAQARLFFNQGYLFIDMGNEGIDHARFNNLFTMLFLLWFARHPEQMFDELGGCMIENPSKQAASPDKILYIGEGSPRWQPGEIRRINLEYWQVPDLVAEVADTTLATDLDEKKQLYAALKIPEYWVIDIRGERMFAFRLQKDGKYQPSEYSGALEGLPIALVEQTIAQLNQGTNGSAALWFAQQIANLE